MKSPSPKIRYSGNGVIKHGMMSALELMTPCRVDPSSPVSRDLDDG